MIPYGFLLIDKENLVSSQKVDLILKKKINTKKIGHLGTLDPLATGLLVVGVNTGTKFFKYFDDLNKKYILKIRLGATSASLDNEQEIINKVDTDFRGKEEMIDELLEKFNREYEQYPPLYSAIKLNGMPLYKYANRGQNVDIKPRFVKIYDLKRISKIEYVDGSSYFDIYLHVSKGFYVRSFSKEIGVLLNVPAMSEKIKRISVGDFDIKDAKTIEDLDINNLNLIDPTTYLSYKKIEINETTYKDVQIGKPLDFNQFLGNYIILSKNNENIAIYRFDEKIIKYRLDLLIKNESIVY